MTTKDKNITGDKIPFKFIAIMVAVTAIIFTLILSSTQTIKDNDKNFNLKIPTPLTAGKLREFKSGAVCVDDAYCAEIGRKTLARNGSAVDAVIAASLCNGLGFMQSMGIGGGFVMTIYERTTKRAYYLNARDRAPLAAHGDMFWNKSGTASFKGPLAVTVPGEIAGYWAAHQRFGKLPWADLFTDTIELCERGWILSQIQLNDLLQYEASIKNDPTLRSLFVNETTKKFKTPGSLIKHDKLCDTFKVIAEKGANEFYNGTLGQTLVEDLRKQGGILTMEDLRNYSAIWQDPLETELSNGIKLFTSNFPSSGALLVFIMNIFDEFKFTPNSINDDENTVETYHRMIETFKFAFAARSKLGDPDYNDLTEVTKNLTSKDYARAIKARINDSRTWNDAAHYEGGTQLLEDHGTAHLVVLSPAGDAVSITSSINTPFGSFLVGEKTGILFNNGMNDFSIPSVVNFFGLPGTSEKNSIQPGKRPLSSMAPSIFVNTDGNVKMVIAASGGTRIITSLACTIARILWMGNTIKEAIDASRIHHQLLPMTLSYESGISKSVIKGLKDLGHTVSQDSYQAYSFVAAILKSNNYIYANSDFRRNGDACGIN
ncbi:glutathione hydrolase 1 proenzyme [Microplitis demolitor]|uniref:glutathione hydrolase 1 proenzyme n=1 Tax=Microplitis demolitor TaxID=69319 RepID=UPI0004CDC137|nr:glutathione hydrolase 1 proenzyme [Microplitis demolitor]